MMNNMTKKHNCSENYFDKTITVLKDIGGDINNILVRGKCCKICGKIIISSEEMKLFEKRIETCNKLMLMIEKYKEE